MDRDQALSLLRELQRKNHPFIDTREAVSRYAEAKSLRSSLAEWLEKERSKATIWVALALIPAGAALLFPALAVYLWSAAALLIARATWKYEGARRIANKSQQAFTALRERCLTDLDHFSELTQWFELDRDLRRLDSRARAGPLRTIFGIICCLVVTGAALKALGLQAPSPTPHLRLAIPDPAPLTAPISTFVAQVGERAAQAATGLAKVLYSAAILAFIVYVTYKRVSAGGGGGAVGSGPQKPSSFLVQHTRITNAGTALWSQHNYYPTLEHAASAAHRLKAEADPRYPILVRVMDEYQRIHVLY